MSPAKTCPSCSFKNSAAKGFCDQCGAPLDAPARPAASPGIQLQAPSPQPAASAPAAAPPPPLGLPRTSIIRAPGAAAKSPAASAAPSAPAPAPKTALTPAVPAPAPGRPKRRFSALSAFLALACLGAGAALWTRGPRAPSAARVAAEQYLTALRDGRDSAAYELLTQAARRRCSLEDFSRIRQATHWDYSGLGAPSVEGDRAVLLYRLAAAGQPAQDDALVLRREGGHWRRPFLWPTLRDAEDALVRGDAAGALELARAAREIDPQDATARAAVCESLYALHDPSGAAELTAECRTALELSSHAPRPLALEAPAAYHVRAVLAETYKDALHEPREAAEQYGAMLLSGDVTPAQQCEALLGRAEALGRLGQSLGAAQDLTRAAGVCPDAPSAEYARQAAALFAAAPPENTL